MLRIPRFVLRASACGLLWLMGISSWAAEKPAAGETGAVLPPVADVEVDFVEHVQPILAKNCYSCHGPDEAEGSLRLDLKADAARGGNSGPAWIAGKSAESRMIHYVAGTSDDGMQMPPDGELLAAADVGLLRAWIDQGADWPDELATASRKGTDHWAFQPIRRAEPPAVAAVDRVRNPIDQFVLARLKQEGIEPSPEADRFTLLRRLALDLTGLPPTPEQIEEFLHDTADGAYERLVDRLLASPHYGERWGRHWLDLARYADSDGYEKDTGRPYAWRYRHWVIEALNRDLPFDEFTRQQLAGDLLPAHGDTGPMVATGFHRNTLRNREGGVDQEEFRVAATVDRVNTTAAVWLGLTMACAQCHSHKYDPITQREYYGLFAFFNSLDEQDIPAPLPDQVGTYQQQLAEFEAAHAPLVAELEEFERQQLPARQAAWEKRRGTSIGAAWTPVEPVDLKSTGGVELRSLPDGSIVAGGPNAASPVYTLTIQTDLPRVTALRLEVLADPGLPGDGPGRSEYGNFVLSELSLSATPRVVPKGEKAVAVPVALRYAEADFSQTKLPVSAAIDGDDKTGWGISPEFGRDHVAVFELAAPIEFEGGARLTVKLSHLYGSQHAMGRFRIAVASQEPPLLALGIADPVARILSTPADQRTAAQQKRLTDYYRASDDVWRRLSTAVARHAKQRPVDPATTTLAQALVELKQPRETHVLVRGDFLRPGAAVEAHVPEVLNRLNCRGKRPDRVDLANWLLDPANPLTARVTVNRIWQQYFGRGLVATENDFGTQGEPPSHPELLDWLASEFMEGGWSLKSLHRMIVTSATYRQSSATRPELQSRDPLNVLLARQRRLRVEAELIRDLTLAASGLLSRKVGGPSVRPPQPQGISELTYAGAAKWAESTGEDRYRRGMYTWFQRTSPYPMLMTFDAPDSNVTCTRRERSNTPLQALTLLNDPVFFECSQALGRRIICETPHADATTDGRADRIRHAVRICLSRDPDSDELATLATLYQEQLALCQADPAGAELLVGPQPRPDRVDTPVLAAWIMVGRTLMNLDEFICRE